MNKDPRETKVDPKWPRSSLVIHCKYHWSTDHEKHHLKSHQLPCYSLYLQSLVEPKNPDFVTFKHLQTVFFCTSIYFVQC